jgi:hypothetical protein
MKMFLATLAIAGASALGLARDASASTFTSPVSVPTYQGGKVRVGVGVNIGGGGYYEPVYAEPAGYWQTEYRWVPVRTLVGYDVYRRPIYQTQYVQQAYQVWVPTRVYAPAYVRPAFSVGFGYTSGHHHHGHRHWK